MCQQVCCAYVPHTVACLIYRVCVCVSQVWSLKLEQEVEKNKLLTEALQTLATEHQDLDQQSLCKGRRSSTLSTLTEDDFYDALSGQSTPTVFIKPLECIVNGTLFLT